MANRTPPRYVPTLTEVVQGAPAAPSSPSLNEEQLVHRVMQRVDLMLDRRLREAIASVVLEHSRSLAPALREQVEAVVARTVSEALAEELAAVPRSPNEPR